jgi:hypothetical protein
MKLAISQRKLDSYKRAEALAQECRRQMVGRQEDIDLNALADFVIHWMKITGKVKFDVPKRPKSI